MSRYRRANAPGGTYFFTVLTYRRREILIEPESRVILREVINEIKLQYPFSIDAWVLLPNHIHSIWTLPPGDSNYPKRWGMIKAGFSKQAKSIFHREGWMNATKTQRRESTCWQRRYWEHQIRNEQDYRRHMDYLHYNPVKHQLVKHVKDWPYSTFHRYVEKGVYTADWCGATDSTEGEFGEC